MKKLKLSLIQEAGEILTPKELKKIIGGKHYGSGTCGAFLPSADSVFGSIGFPSIGSLPPESTIDSESISVNTKNNTTVHRGISKEAALDMTQGISGAKWCCDNCSEASWY